MEETWSHCGTVGAPPLAIGGCRSQLCLCHQMPRAKGNLCLSLVSLWSWDWPHGLRVVGIQDGAPAEGKRDRNGPNRPVAAPTPTLLKPPLHSGASCLLPGSILCTAVPNHRVPRSPPRPLGMLESFLHHQAVPCPTRLPTASAPSGWVSHHQLWPLCFLQGCHPTATPRTPAIVNPPASLGLCAFATFYSLSPRGVIDLMLGWRGHGGQSSPSVPC